MKDLELNHYKMSDLELNHQNMSNQLLHELQKKENAEEMRTVILVVMKRIIKQNPQTTVTYQLVFLKLYTRQVSHRRDEDGDTGCNEKDNHRWTTKVRALSLSNNSWSSY